MRSLLALSRVAAAGIVAFVGVGLTRYSSTGLAASDRASGVLLLGTGIAGVYRSLDGGRNWQPAGAGLPGGGVWQVQADPTTPNTGYATTGSLYRTSDGGHSWTRVPGVSAGGPGFTALAAQGPLVMAAGSTGIVEGGSRRRWALQPVVVPGGAPLQIMPVGKDLLYAVGSDGRLYVRGNASWLRKGEWQTLRGGLPEGRITALAYEPQSLSPNTSWPSGFCTVDSCIGMYVAEQGRGVWQSTDSGRTWTQETREDGALPQNCTVRALLTSANDIGTAYAAVDGEGLYRSAHSGQFWKPATDGPHAVTITALLQVGSTIVAATAGQGVLLYDLTGDVLRYSGIARGLPAGMLGLSLTQLRAPAPPVQSAPTLHGPCRYADLRRAYTLCGPFLRFYQSANPPWVIFGNAISPLMYDRLDPHLVVQYFERARFEYRHGTVVLTPLGRLLTRGRHFPKVSALPLPLPEQYFPRTGYSVGGPFLKFWRQHGQERLLGAPISPLFEGTNGDGSGRRYILQYFENVRMEYHPELNGTKFSVQLGSLGVRYLQCMRGGVSCTS
jgi:photosystem II stability/assembly factor-like uncharacterized protein